MTNSFDALACLPLRCGDRRILRVSCRCLSASYERKALDSRVVLEVTDSVCPGWNDYLDDAEGTHRATMSLGMGRDLSKSGQSIRVLGSRPLAPSIASHAATPCRDE